jgi:hypothetical protein
MTSINDRQKIVVFNYIAMRWTIIATCIIWIIMLTAVIEENNNSGFQALAYFLDRLIKTFVVTLPCFIGLYVFSKKIVIDNKEIRIIWLFGCIKRVYKIEDLTRVYYNESEQNSSKIAPNVYLVFKDQHTFVIGSECKNFERAKNFLFNVIDTRN